MSVSAKYNLKLHVDEVLALGLDNVANPTAVHETTDESGTLNAGSTPPATKAWSDERQLAGGTDTFDLTALANGNLANVDFTGLKVQLVKIVADPTNTDDIVVADGASNGYHLFGDASGQITLGPGGAALLFFQDSLPDVSGTAKNVTVTSADADAIYDIILVAG